MDKKILVVCQRFWPEDIRINDICQGLVEKGCKVDVLCGKPNYPFGQFYPGYTSFKPKKEKYGRIRIYRALELRKAGGSALNMFLSYFTFPLSSRLRTHGLRKSGYDAVLVYQVSPLLMDAAGFKIAKRDKIPLTMYVVDLWPQAFFKEMDMHSHTLKKIFSNVSKKHYLKADKIVTTGEKAKKYFERELNVNPGRVSCIPLCPEKKFSVKQKNDYYLEKYAGGFNVVFPGEISENQDLETLLKAGDELLRAGFYKVRIIVCGKGLMLDELKKKVADGGLQDVFYFEETDDKKLAGLLNAADALISCRNGDAEDEYFVPTDVVDILSAGLPVIVTGSAAKNMVRKAKCGFSFEPGDVEGLVSILKKLSTLSSDKLNEMGRNSLKFQLENFNRGANIDKLLDVMFNNEEADPDEPEVEFILLDESDEEEFEE